MNTKFIRLPAPLLNKLLATAAAANIFSSHTVHTQTGEAAGAVRNTGFLNFAANAERSMTRWVELNTKKIKRENAQKLQHIAHNMAIIGESTTSVARVPRTVSTGFPITDRYTWKTRVSSVSMPAQSFSNCSA